MAQQQSQSSSSLFYRLSSVALCVALTACSSPESQAQSDVAQAGKTHVQSVAANPAQATEKASTNVVLNPEETAKLVLSPVHTQLVVEPVMPATLQAGLLQGELTVEPFEGTKKPLKATLTVTNNQAYTVGLRFNSGMTADLQLLSHRGQRLWAWSDDMMFTQALRDTQLAPGKQLFARFSIPVNALAKIPADGAILEAKLAGKALESEQVTMAPVVLSVSWGQ